MSHPIRHFSTIATHYRYVLYYAAKLGIFWHALRHDLSKLSPAEFWPSAHYYAGTHSPVDNERRANHYYSRIAQHHTKRNPHHWEYWTDFYGGRLIVKTMPYAWATEYVVDTLAASRTYHKKAFTPTTALDYFRDKSKRFYMTRATKEYIDWCLAAYAKQGFAGLKKAATKEKYASLVALYPDVEVVEALHPTDPLPPLDSGTNQ